MAFSFFQPQKALSCSTSALTLYIPPRCSTSLPGKTSNGHIEIMRMVAHTIQSAAVLLALLALGCCVRGIVSVPTAAEVDVSGGVGVAADPTACRFIAFSPNPPFHPDSMLEPHISAKTVDHHYRAHQKGYVVKLNSWIASTPSKAVAFPADRGGSSVVSELVRGSEAGSSVNNLASQIFNHALYFAALRGPEGRALSPDSPLGVAIAGTFGSFGAFQAAFAAKAVSHFGSGWVWLLRNNTRNGELVIVDSHDASTPISVNVRDGVIPIVVCDVWEHAYYLDRQQRRDSYVDAWFRVLDWGFAEARFVADQVEFTGDGSYPNFFPPSFVR